MVYNSHSREESPAENVAYLYIILAVTCHSKFTEGSTHCEYC
jgi:hypothetical protein